MAGVKDVQSKRDLDEALGGARPVVLHFWASWCDASKQMDQVFAHLATDFPHALFLRVEAEEQPEISEAYAISAVPYFVFSKDGKTIDTLEGANPSSLANKVAKVAGSIELAESAAPASLGMAAGPTILEAIKDQAKENGSSHSEAPNSGITDALNKHLQQLVNSHPVLLFMKGSPEQPKCGFSRKVVEILKDEGVEFGSFDILTDNDIREGMKKFSNWPTFPQLYCKGELLGGCDIVVAMHESGELKASEDLSDGKTIDTLEGANPSSLANKVAKVAGSIELAESAAPASLGMAAGPTILEAIKDQAKENGSSHSEAPNSGITDALNKHLQQLVNSHPVLLFMKGSPEQPKCGFSRKVVEILKDEGVEFGSFDILTDNDIREGMKKFSNWPTFPQLYCKGELLGGCDIVVAMHESGELKEAFADHGIPVSNKISAAGSANVTSSVTSVPGNGGSVTETTGLSAALTVCLESLVNSSPVMVFMKGKPEEPKCGFSRKVVDILQQEDIQFGSFDILSDDEVRQGLKVYSNWSSYPQLYIKGELIGGSDITMEMQKSGELKRILAEKGIVHKETLEERLKKLTSSSPVMLFMKGTPDVPRCGFSSKVVNALHKEGISFGSFDILTDEEVRQGLKTFSNWPTFPQLYYKGELMGGCDIILELHIHGELKSTLSE